MSTYQNPNHPSHPNPSAQPDSLLASAEIKDPEHDQHKGPHDPNEINPKMASDIAYWSKEFGVSGPVLHEAIRTHGTHVDKVRKALATHSVNLT